MPSYSAEPIAMAPPTHVTPSILIVEDDPDLAGLLQIHLGDLGYATHVARDGRSGLEMALRDPFALLILDLMLPGLDGLEVCKRIRAENRALPILMLTAKSEELDKVLGLELGADDYLTKPFSIRELLARVKALLRRFDLSSEIARPADASVLMFGDLTVDVDKRKVTLRGEALELTAKEFELLLLFARNPGRAYSRQELLDLVWGYQYSGYSHTVNTHINRLRNKIEADPADPRFIQTVWGHGYRFAEAEKLHS
ncbi:MAG: response regulator transcription factor [Rhodothermales bacterium]|nr:response regulator transcription factor [Rhodothermales bacterium]